MAEGQQAGAGALQHRDAAAPQVAGGVRVDGGGHVAEHRDRLAGPAGGVGHARAGRTGRRRTRHQVHGERDRGTAGSSASAASEPASCPCAGARAPHVQRVARLQARVEQPGEPPVVAALTAANGTPSSAARSATWARSRPESCTVAIPRRGTPGRRARGPGGPMPGEQFQRVGQLGQVGDPVHAVGRGQRLPCPVRGGQRAGVRRHQGPAAGRPARGEQDHRDVPRLAAGQHRRSATGVPDRLQHQGQHPGLRQVSAYRAYWAARGDQFLAGGRRRR